MGTGVCIFVISVMIFGGIIACCYDICYHNIVSQTDKDIGKNVMPFDWDSCLTFYS